MVDEYKSRKTKLLVVRMSPEQYATLTEAVEKHRAAERHFWYRNKMTVSKLVCLAASDFISRSTENSQEFFKSIEPVKGKAGKK